jgi:hypothetical protein
VTTTITHTATITGSESGFTFGDLRALVVAGDESGVPEDRRVTLHVSRGDQRDPGTSTLTLSLDRATA